MAKEGNLLIVDDNSSILGALRLLLERHFAKVTTLTSPKLLDTVLRGEAVDAVQAETMTKQERATYALGQTAETFKKVFPFILLGVAIGALIHNWIPQDIVEAVLGDGNPFAVVLAKLIGAPIYADIFGTIPIAEALFSHANYDGFFLEYDSDRSGSFEPLRFIKNQTVVLGLITSKFPELEDKDAVKARIEEATKYVPLNQLCLSPQCGFSSTEEGNIMTEEEQWAKVRLVREIADEVWGDK